jgi:hypothetical protein
MALRKPWIVGLACAAWLVGMPAHAEPDERARLAQERRALDVRFANEERACAERFRVTACVEDVRLRRREALAPVRERELKLDEAERLSRATQRRKAVAAKQAAAASSPASAAPPPPAPQLRVRPAPAASPPSAGRPSVGGTERAAQAEQRVQQAQQRREQALAAQQRIQQRLAERDASAHKSAPLPPPAAAAASATRR